MPTPDDFSTRIEAIDCMDFKETPASIMLPGDVNPDDIEIEFTEYDDA